MSPSGEQSPPGGSEKLRLLTGTEEHAEFSWDSGVWQKAGREKGERRETGGMDISKEGERRSESVPIADNCLWSGQLGLDFQPRAGLGHLHHFFTSGWHL